MSLIWRRNQTYYSQMKLPLLFTLFAYMLTISLFGQTSASKQLDSKQSEITLTIGPNPFAHSFNVGITTTKEVQFAIVTITGRKIEEGTLRSENHIDMSDHPAGLYYFITEVNGKIIRRQLSKNE